MSRYVLINPLQEILSLADYNKAIEKADTFSKKNEMPTEEKKPRGRPIGTIKKPKPEEIEKKAVGRPKKVLTIITKPTIEESKEETRQEETKEEPKKKVGRPSKELKDYDTIHEEGIFDTRHFKNQWWLDYDSIKKTLDKFFKEPENQFIRLHEGKYETYSEKLWKPIPKVYLAQALFNKLRLNHPDPSNDYNLSPDRQEYKQIRKKIGDIMNQYIEERFI